MNIMKTSLILLITATAVPFLTLLGLGAIGAFSLMTALSIVATLSLDYGNRYQLAYAREAMAPGSAKLTAKQVSEAHPLAA